jgi:hypothetical protein
VEQKKKKKEAEGRRRRSNGVMRHTTLFIGRDRKFMGVTILR